ncbi:MAG TPA: serine hydrolase domain-containing protein [Candidatus Saccharimonadales bacterium]|nr:serine hydrolase domain-containing protein [Candidatus Saccharimonadales bacterium]
MSGMPFQSSLETPTYDTAPLAALVRSYAMTPLQAEPGTRYAYSSAGINIAGRIIEVVSKMSYEDFMQERLFKPLGMKDTTFWPSEKQAPRVAKSYRPGGAKTNLAEFQITQLAYPLSDRAHRFPIPAGGLFSTAEDTAHFCQMMLNGGEWKGRRYVSEASFKELTSRQTPASVKENYGLCFSLGPDWFGHGGAQASNMEINMGKGLVIIWMVQHGGFPGQGGKAQGAFRNWALK